MKKNKKILKIFASTIALCALFLVLPHICKATYWYNGDWQYRTKINVLADKVGVDLINFPTYLNLSLLGTNFWQNVGTGCGDIRITNDDGLTELPREIVDCEIASTTGELWFKADELQNTATTSFYIYYGNSESGDYEAGDTFGKNNVWTGFNKVYHLQNNSYDSTNNGNNGADLNISYPYSKIIHGANATNSGNSEIDLSDGTEISGTDQFSLSFWIYVPSYSTSYVSPFSRRDSYPADWALVFQGADTSKKVYFGLPGNDIFLDDNYVYATGWSHYVINRSGNFFKMYVDGVEVGADTNSATIGSAQKLQMFRANDNSLGLEAGWKLDEVRFSDNAHSNKWIETEFNNQFDNNSFFEINLYEEVPPDVPYVPNDQINFSLTYNNTITCITDQLCKLIINATTDENGWLVNLAEQGVCNSDQSFLATTTIINGQGILTIPNESSSMTHYYQIVNYPVNLSVVECGWLRVNWITTLPSLYVYDLNSACDNMATTSAGWWDSIRFGIECAGRKIVYWSFTPRPESLTRWDSYTATLQNKVPFSIRDDLKSLLESATSTDDMKITVPALWANPIYQIEIFSSSSIENAFGQNNYNSILTVLHFMIYLSGLTFIIFRFIL